MSDELHQSVIVENKPGASTSIAGDTVAKSAPDGYTLFMAGNANAVNAVSKPLPPFDVLTAFTPIGVVVRSPSILVSAPSVGIKSVAEIVDKAKAQPNQISYASSGVAATSHLAGVLFASAEKIKLVHVPYKGSSQAMNDVLAGRVSMMFAPISTALPLVKAGTLVALATTSDEREKDLPNVPTLSELGIKGIDLDIWSGFVAPTGTPADRIAILANAMQTALKNKDVQTQFENRGMKAVVGAGADEFTRHMKADITKLKGMVADGTMTFGH
ncbi:MAG: tripartite tricarboxylate transporter substrate binding protein [Rhodopseudomonas sp.]|nr:tripartite tricarboxylate transporter substrate binding protein [Rhodopseudomonas sp.]